MAKKKTAGTFKVGRDAGSGKFVTLAEAKQRPKTTVVETINKAEKKPTKPRPGTK